MEIVDLDKVDAFFDQQEAIVQSHKDLIKALSALRAAPYESSQQPRHGLIVRFSPDMIRQADAALFQARALTTVTGEDNAN